MDRGSRVVATSDIILAAVLLVRGFHLVGSEPDPEDAARRKRFILQGTATTFEELRQRLLLGDVLVPARAFALAQRRLKRLLYEESRARTTPAEGRS